MIVPRIIVELDPERLENPDLDLRYALPDLLAERSHGTIRDEGYDYVPNSNLLRLFLNARDREIALKCIVEVIETERLLENNLRPGTAVAVESNGILEVVYPPERIGTVLDVPNSQPD